MRIFSEPFSSTDSGSLSGRSTVVQGFAETYEITASGTLRIFAGHMRGRKLSESILADARQTDGNRTAQTEDRIDGNEVLEQNDEFTGRFVRPNH